MCRYCNFLQNGHTITGRFYVNLHLPKAKKKTPRKTDEMFFPHDNAPVHKSLISMAAVDDCVVELVDHPPFSPEAMIICSLT